MILILIINVFLSENIALAKKIEINDKDVERIKSSLDTIKTFTNITITNDNIKTVLNMVIKAGETGTDVTYGLLVLTAMNEMDLIDMVISQRYKQEATAYFNHIIDERTNLISYWKGVGFDLPRVLSGKVSGQITGLALNSFSITDKVISIFTTFNVIRQEKLYDGLWYYFSLRRENKESHQTAWEEAEIVMGWAPVDISILFNPQKLDTELFQLESQFAQLWDKWGPYTDSNGVTEAAKRQFKEEMGQIVLEAIVQQALAEKEPSLLDKLNNIAGDLINKTYGFVTNIWNTIKSTLSQLNPFGAQVGQVLFPDDVPPPLPEETGLGTEQTKTSASEPSEPKNEPTDTESPESPQIQQTSSQRTQEESLILAELQKQLDDIAQKADILNQKITELVKEKNIKEDELTQKEVDDQEKEPCFLNSIDINNASKQDLQKIIGVGPVIAQKIIKERPFYSLNDLIKVSGIGPATLQKIITQGCAYVTGYSNTNTTSNSGSNSGSSGSANTSTNSNNNTTQPSSFQEEKSFDGCSEGQININTASKEKLMEVELVGDDRAQDIIDRREKKLFKSLDEITEISGIGTSILQNFKNANYCADLPQQEPQQQPQQQQESEPPTNILLNEFFDEWELEDNKPDYWKPTHWSGSHSFKNNWFQDNDAFFGDYSVRVGTTATSTRTLSQIDLNVQADTYYASVYLKGGGQARVAILMGETGDSEYSPWVDIQDTSWTELTYSRTISAGNKGGIQIQTQGNQANTLIGAAWLSTSPAPTSWPQGLAPNPVENFHIASSTYNIVTLNWSAAVDPDTPPENLSYEIYYSREGELTENNLNATTTQAATTTQTTITISDLSYDSTYYFGIKAFDRQNNYSPLATTTDFLQIPSALINSPWPTFQQDAGRSGQSSYLGPLSAPEIIWIYNEESYPNNPSLDPGYGSPIISPQGTIYVPVFYQVPSKKNGVLALNPDGTKKWFEENDVIGNYYLALQSDGSISFEDGGVISKAVDAEGTVYYGQENVLYAFDQNGNKKWERSFEVEDINSCPSNFNTPVVAAPTIGKNGIIYVVVSGKSCNEFGDLQDHLYAIDPKSENEILWNINLGGYATSRPVIGPDGTVYITDLFFGKYAWGPRTSLKVLLNGQLKREEALPTRNSLPIVDAEGNVYIAVYRSIWKFDKNGEKIWEKTIENTPGNWYYGIDIGLALSKEGVLYVTGRGAIFALNTK